MTVTGRVTNGRLVVDEPTELPEGAVVELHLADPEPAITTRHAEVVRRVESVQRGDAVTLSLAEVEESLRAELDF